MTVLMATAGPNGTPVRAWNAYALAALPVLAACAAVTSLLVERAAVPAVWFAAACAYVVQLAAFAGLVRMRDDAYKFLLGWALGIALRFGALGGVAWWLSRSAALPRSTALLSLVGFVFLLLLLEPVFLRWDLRRSR
jgi:hypothetical protein